MAIDSQKLIFKGKAMENGVILSDVGVKDEDQLVLMKLIAKKPQEKN